MNIEVEKKFEISDYNTVKGEIEALGANKVSTTNDVDVYFVVPQIVPNTRYLRVRTKNSKATMAYHEVINDVETKEWESDVTDGDIVKTIIGKLGFEEDVTVNKTREKYILGGSEILVDHIEGLGYFLEIESPDEEQLDSIANKITLGSQVSGQGYPDMVRTKKNHETSTK